MEKINYNFLEIFSDNSFPSESGRYLTNLTIVIPTCDRPAYLLRQIVYLSKWKVRVEIVDGSLQPLDSKAIKLIEKLPHINYRHLGGVSYPDRITLACEWIKTPYAMCLADDDFYLQSGILAAIKALESDTEAVACMGQSLGFDIYNKNRYLFKYGSSLCDYAVNDESASSRISAGMKDYRSAAFYAVFRSDAFLSVWRKRDRLSCVEAVEYEHAIRTYLCGGLITTPAIYWLRSFELQAVSSVVDGSRANNFSSWYSDNKFRQEYELFRSRLIDIFCEQGVMTVNEAETLFNLIVESILEKSHVGLMEQTTSNSMMDGLSKLIKYAMSGGFGGLRKTKFWQSAKTRVFYKARERVDGSSIGNPEICGELHQVLEFANRFATVLNK